MSSREGGNLSCRASNTATDIENPHSPSNVDHVCHVMFMSCQSLLKCFSFFEAAEMKRPWPTYLILVRSQIIVAFNSSFSLAFLNLFLWSLLVHQRHVLRSSRLACFVIMSIFPVLLIVILHFLKGLAILPDQRKIRIRFQSWCAMHAFGNRALLVHVLLWRRFSRFSTHGDQL